MEIKKTKDFTIFKKMEGNRSLDKYHIKKLKASIEKDNMLHLHPIIVNENFSIIDGQHRLEAAQQLDVDIYFIQSNEVKDQHLIESNVNQKSWEVENYIDFFAVREKNADYLKLKNMMIQSSLKPKALLTLLLGVVSNSILEFLKTGKFRFPENSLSEKIFENFLDFFAYIKDKRINPFSMFTNANFTKAFRWIFNTQGFEKEIFYKKLDLRWFDLKPQKNAEDWYKLLISIYNFKNHSRLEDEYSNKT